jgi:site-specific DNA-methyltransferase (adenine-specific)
MGMCPLTDLHFELIIGNPPYQQHLHESGRGLGAVPIYQKFVEQALALHPHFLTMIIPSRWFAGGVGLEKFRQSMLHNRHIRYLADYTNARDCFPGVDIGGGICYFLYDAQYEGDCTYKNITCGRESISQRRLDEFPVFIRSNEAVSIVRKVLARQEKTLSAPGGCSSQTPFGFLSTYRGMPEPVHSTDCELFSSRGRMYVSRAQVRKNRELIDLYKPMISKLSCEHAGTPGKNGCRVLSRMELLKPGQLCTQSYLTVCGFEEEESARNAYAYLRTKFVRFLILQTLTGMNISVRSFRFVPWLPFDRLWTDEALYARYCLTEEEKALIEHTIRHMD